MIRPRAGKFDRPTKNGAAELATRRHQYPRQDDMTLSPTPDNNGPERAAPQRISSDELLRSAIDLRQQGYGVVPVGGERGKDALASGFHGYSAGDAALGEIRFWPNQFGQRWTHNAVRCPVGVLGIDVDNYVSRGKDKRGLATITEYEQRFGAKLPATYITTAREGGSGIRWYRIPGDYQGPGVLTADDQLSDGVEPGVELIARHLRYGVVRGIHSETGEPYRLHGPDGALVAGGLLPTPAELPELPSEWVEGLAALCPTRALVGRLFNRDEIDLWLDAHTGNEYPHGLPQVVKRFHSLVDSGEKNRHKAMFPCLCWALKESYVGGYPAREAEQRLRAEWLAKIAGDPNHDEHEFDNMLRRAIDAAEGDDHVARWARMVRDYATDTRDYAGLVDGVQFHTESTAAQGVCPVSDATVLTYTDATGSPDSITVADFWQSRQVLADLYQFAKSRRCGPWAMLGNVMLRAASAIPPDVVLPPVVGGQASLNLYVAFAGNSGDGKGAATVAADDWLNCDTTPYTAEAGSGEGMVKQFAYKQNQRGQPPAQTNMRWSVLFDVREIDTLGAIGGRNSSTMLPILRSAYSGEALGFSYADPTKAIKLCAHRYRFCMGVGVQPKNAGTLLHDSDGGTPQRYVWLPVLDPDMPDERPSAPPALTLRNWEDVAPKKKVGKDGTYTLVAGADHLGLLDTDSRPHERTERVCCTIR